MTVRDRLDNIDEGLNAFAVPARSSVAAVVLMVGCCCAAAPRVSATLHVRVDVGRLASFLVGFERVFSGLSKLATRGGKKRL